MLKVQTFGPDPFTTRTSTVLSPEEIRTANEIGARRDAFARRRGSRDTAGFNGGLPTHQRGARCELAAAKILRLPWNVPFDTKFDTIRAAADVGGFEVRSTALPNGCLVIREKDRDDAVFILAVEQRHPLPGREAYRVTLAGWLFGGDAKRDLYVRSPNGHRPAYFVWQSALRPMEDLPHNDRAVMA